MVDDPCKGALSKIQVPNPIFVAFELWPNFGKVLGIRHLTLLKVPKEAGGLVPHSDDDSTIRVT